MNKVPADVQNTPWREAVNVHGVTIYSYLVSDEGMGGMEAMTYLGNHLDKEDEKGLLRKILTEKVLKREDK